MSQSDNHQEDAIDPALDATIQAGPSTHSPEPSAGDHVRYFGEYEILEEIARGGMGVVFKARQVKLNRTVALKMILSGELAGEEEVRRFKTEAEAAANLDHPGIVPIYEIGEHEGQHYFSMGFVEGQSLADRVKDGPLPPSEAAELLKKVAGAVAYAHEKGVVHRDLKPANVLLDANGEPRVTDFGLAKQVESDSDLTRTGAVMGTPSYMSPEQASGNTDQVGPRSDVYSLGAVLYCLITGRPPFQSASPMELLRQLVENEPVPPREFDASIPRDLETICLKAIAKTGDRRYESAHSLAADLGRFLRGEAILARRPSLLYRTQRFVSRNRLLVVITGIATSLVILGVALGFAWLTADLARQRAETEKQRLEASRLGAISISDPEQLHARAIKLNTSKSDYFWRLHIPAGKSYRIRLHSGTFSGEHAMGTDPRSNNHFRVATIDAHSSSREVVFSMSFQKGLFTVIGGEPPEELIRVATGGNDPAKKTVVSGLRLPPAFSRFFDEDVPALKQFATTGLSETAVMARPPGPLVLAKATAWDYPSEVTNGEKPVGEWMKTINDPGYGYVVWIEPAPLPAASIKDVE